jgi:hypothetical protein
MKSLLQCCETRLWRPLRGTHRGKILIDDDDFKVQIGDYGKQCDSSQIKPRYLDQIKPGRLGTHFTNEIMDDFSYCTERLKDPLLNMVKN